MNKKFYKVKQDTFIWEKDAIITNNSNEGKGYTAISDVYNKLDPCKEYISDYMIEKNSDWFERVYEANLITKVVYKTKEEYKEFLNKQHSSEG
jgi:hypothetical protein